MPTGGPVVPPKVPTGQLKALAVSTRERVPFATDLPTIAESGLSGVEAVQWYGVVAPAGTPAPVIDRLNSAINAQLDSPHVALNLASDGALAVTLSPEAFGRHIAEKIALWREAIATNGLRVE